MAKVTQIDYQNALYDIEDADAQSKISDLQTAVGNTYTKAQVDTKFDNYYDKTQTENLTKKRLNFASQSYFVIKERGSHPRTFTAQTDGFAFVWAASSNPDTATDITISIDGNSFIPLTSVKYVKDIFSFPIRKGQTISCDDLTANLQYLFVAVNVVEYA